MKRHEALVQLSREHQMALQLAVEAKRCENAEQRAMLVEKCQQAFKENFEAHFQEEETRLLPNLRKAYEWELVDRIEKDHALLRKLAAKLPDWNQDDVLQFSETMLSHVRFEERQVFPRYETLFLN